MNSKTDKLVRMSNQISDFFKPYSDEEAAAGIHEHLSSFWTRSMLGELSAFAKAGGKGLQPRVLLAMMRFGEESSPIHKAVAGPEEVGQATSDAG